MPSLRRPTGISQSWINRLAFLAVVVVALTQGLLAADAASPAAAPTADAAQTKMCNVKQQLPNGRVVTVYRTKVVRRRVGGKLVRRRVPLTRLVRRNGRRVRVKVPRRAPCSRTRLCVVRKRGKIVYLTRIGRVRVIRGNRIVTVRRRVFVYRWVTRTVRGKKRRVRRKVAKLGRCPTRKTAGGDSGIPVRITLTDGSVASLDFGGFQREIELTGDLTGFIVGEGFVLGQDNRIELTRGRINLEPTGIFIDDVCKGRVTDAVRTHPESFAEIDQTKTGNAVNVAPNSSVTGRVNLRIQTALWLRNDDHGCDDPYITTGWTDFQLPLFLRGTIGTGGGGLQSRITTGETVLNELSACLAPGDPKLPCNGFAIPFPAIFTSKIVAQVKIG